MSDTDWRAWARKRLGRGEHVVIAAAGCAPELLHPGCRGVAECEWNGYTFAEDTPAITGHVYVPRLDENMAIAAPAHVEWADVVAGELDQPERLTCTICGKHAAAVNQPAADWAAAARWKTHDGDAVCPDCQPVVTLIASTLITALDAAEEARS